MAIEVKINNVSIQYPQIGDTEWGNNATNFAIQTATAFNAIGLSNGTTVDLPGTLDVTGNTTLDSNLAVGGTLGVTGDFAINTNKFNVTASSGNTTIAGQALASDGTALLPGISFSSDSNTGIFRSGSDQLDIVTGGSSRFRIESTGQIKAVYESQVGTDYNTQLDNGYLCRAWVNFNGTGTVAIRASGNVSSITDNGTGDYTVNFTTAMPDANYSVVWGGSYATTPSAYTMSVSITTLTTSSFKVQNRLDVAGYYDFAYNFLGIFR